MSRPVDEVLAELRTVRPDTPAALALATEAVAAAIEHAAAASDALARRVYWLNVVLAVATVAGVVVAALQGFR